MNALELAKHTFLPMATIKSHKVVAQLTATQGLAQKSTITHEEEKAASILFLTGAFTIWYMLH